MFYRVIFYLVFVIVYDKVTLQLPQCDETKKSNLREGNIGETNQFPWLGVLRVHSHENDAIKIGLTGLVLIRRKYGIVNADDVAQIPTQLFTTESKAMFILEKQETWMCEVKNRHLHPEYEYSTYNTIALIELSYDYNDFLIPICQPDSNYNTSNQLYALGYVDDNRLLEKVIHKIQYIKHGLCEDFYNRIGHQKSKFTDSIEFCHSKNKITFLYNYSTSYKPIYIWELAVSLFKDKSVLYKPTNYYCGFASNNKNHCVWDNGMVLASNTTGVWVLIGFGIKGPGCSAPSRFIQILPYLPWIETSTDEIEVF